MILFQIVLSSSSRAFINSLSHTCNLSVIFRQKITLLFVPREDMGIEFKLNYDAIRLGNASIAVALSLVLASIAPTL